MLITKKTKTKDILPLLTKKELLDELLDKVPPVPLKKPIISMTIKEFSNIILDEEAYINKLLSKRRALTAFGMIKTYRSEMQGLSSWLKKHEIAQTAEEKQAAADVDFPSMIERMLITVTKFFNLSSMDKAEKRYVNEYLLILKDQTADVKYQRNYQSILERKANANRNSKRRK